MVSRRGTVEEWPTPPIDSRPATPEDVADALTRGAVDNGATQGRLSSALPRRSKDLLSGNLEVWCFSCYLRAPLTSANSLLRGSSRPLVRPYFARWRLSPPPAA
jgi:hypothetical protein